MNKRKQRPTITNLQIDEEIHCRPRSGAGKTPSSPSIRRILLHQPPNSLHRDGQVSERSGSPSHLSRTSESHPPPVAPVFIRPRHLTIHTPSELDDIANGSRVLGGWKGGFLRCDQPCRKWWWSRFSDIAPPLFGVSDAEDLGCIADFVFRAIP